MSGPEAIEAVGREVAPSPIEIDPRQVDAGRKQGIPPAQWFYVELPSPCNLKCPFCPSPTLKRPRQLMDPALAKSVFSQIGEYVRRQDMSGYLQLKRMVFLHVMGEPLLHPDFVKCVGYARDAGLVPALFTNCTLLNEKHIQKIFDAGISHVTLSLNATDDAGYKSLGTKDSFDDQEQRVLELLHHRAERDARWLHVDIQYIASAGRTVRGTGFLETEPQVWELYRRWLLRVRHMGGGYANLVGNRPHAPPAVMMNPLNMDGVDPSLQLPLDEGIDLVVKSGCSFGNAMLPDGVVVEPSTSGHCPFDNPSRQMAIFADGSVSFCNLDYENSVNLGNLQELTIDEIWTGERMQGIRESMALGRLSEPVCQRCLGFLRRVA
ncbi:MAG: radical SAM/SPASM domain-containing protein [Pseudomonadota bacterium]